MGYSINSNTNKRSLGRNNYSDLFLLYKYANLADASSNLSGAIKDFTSKVKEYETSLEILAALSSKEVQSKAFDSKALGVKLNNILTKNKEDVEYFKFYVEALSQMALTYNTEYLASTDAFSMQGASHDSIVQKMQEAFAANPGLSISKGHEQKEFVAIVQGILEKNGYNLKSHGVNGNFSDDTENSVILFQQENGLSPTGIVDSLTFSKMMTAPKPLSRDSKREQNKRMRQERRSDHRGASRGKFSADGLSNIILTSKRVDIEGSSSLLKEYLKILNNTAVEIGGKISITSANRDSYNQSRIMYGNYKRRGVGSNRANKYLNSLYRRLPRINDITNVFAGSANKDQKIREAEQIIETAWPKGGHRSGKSIDVRFGSKVQEILQATQSLATVDILKESDHFHVTIKSLKPGGIKKMRRFRPKS